MNCTLRYIGYMGHTERYEYQVIADNGVTFVVFEDEYHGKTGTRISLDDDMCALDSGWVHAECEKCKWRYWTRTRPKGKITCPVCGTIEECPEGVRLKEEENDDDA